jgi:predicted  nucleic acid-binding Zn-ribbon protein
MLPDLQHLIHLQQLDDFMERARRTIADQPARSKALDDRLEKARAHVASARQRAADSGAARRALEKDLAVVQGRLGKFKDQLMEVKTNREYQAMQKEIEVAQQEVRGIEDRILERMLEADDVASAVKQAEAALTAEQKDVEGERKAMEDENARLQLELERSTTERQVVLAQISPQVLSTYHFIAQKRTGAVAEARDGLCTICHVRLRPKVFNDVRRNDTIIQCESCQRILYFASPVPAQGEAASSE